jgi:hypothetical protein
VIFETGLREMPLVNIQAAGTMARPHHCRQVATAVARKTQESQVEVWERHTYRVEWSE